jgi:hypothetical protein
VAARFQRAGAFGTLKTYRHVTLAPLWRFLLQLGQQFLEILPLAQGFQIVVHVDGSHVSIGRDSRLALQGIGAAA